MRIVIGFVFTVALSVYLGGALVMELVWRPAQRDLPPPQVGVLCHHMGRRYRWVALGALGVLAAAWFAGRATGRAGALGLAGAASGRLPVAVSPAAVAAACWGVLVALVLAMGVLLHPRSHQRGRARAGGGGAETRRRRLHAMRAMEVLLRLELVVALAATALAVVAGGGWGL